MYPTPMNDIVSNLMALQMSGGGTYANEPKIITSNGEYTPSEGVRWDKVTVDVPTYVSDIPSMPAIGGGSIGSKYRYLFHRGQTANRYGCKIASQAASVTVNNQSFDYILQDYSAAELWVAIYKNDGNKMLCAYYLGVGSSDISYNGFDYYKNRYFAETNDNNQYTGNILLSYRYEYLGGGITSKVKNTKVTNALGSAGAIQIYFENHLMVYRLTGRNNDGSYQEEVKEENKLRNLYISPYSIMEGGYSQNNVINNATPNEVMEYWLEATKISIGTDGGSII